MWSGEFDIGALLNRKKYSQIEDCNWEIWLNRNVNVNVNYKNRNENKILKWEENETTKSK